MIDTNTHFGRAVLIFFWGGLAASVVNMIWVMFPFNILAIAWAVVLVNILVVTIKNIVIPAKKK